MNDTTYMIIKPDGLPFLDTIIHELELNDISVTKSFMVKDFDKLCIPLYLDHDAIERGNTPIIIGINNVYKKCYRTTTAIILLLNSKKTERKQDFIVRVCALKKELRRKYFHGYKTYEGTVSKKDYETYGATFSEHLAAKRSLCHNGDGWLYSFQINGIHSPDDINAYNREIYVLEEAGAFKHPIEINCREV